MARPDRKRVLVYGATGQIGRHLVVEARRRGHRVVGVSRSRASGLVEGIEYVRSDAVDAEAVAHLSPAFDVVVSATRPASGREAEHAAAIGGLIRGLETTSRPLVVVGGAASLRVPGSARGRVLDDPRFVREAWRPIAQACVEQLARLRASRSLAWTYVSPPAFLEPGPRTGSFRRGGERLLVDEEGRSRISFSDFAVAVIDETERKPLRRCVTVAY